MAHPIRDYRTKEGLSQDELAERLGVSRQMVGLVETGERRIAAEDVAEWERKTGIPRAKLRPDIFGKAVA
jgi:transcriptional regulator with XRE-family HTH domain